MKPPRVVIDTNVLFEGLTRQGGAAGRIVELWLERKIEVCVSTSLAYEYVDVLSRKLSTRHWDRIRPLLGRLLQEACFVTIYFSWRPISPDPGDDHVIDCAMNAGALIISANVRDFMRAQEMLGLTVVRPEEFLARLREK